MAFPKTVELVADDFAHAFTNTPPDLELKLGSPLVTVARGCASFLGWISFGASAYTETSGAYMPPPPSTTRLPRYFY